MLETIKNKPKGVNRFYNSLDTNKTKNISIIKKPDSQNKLSIIATVIKNDSSGNFSKLLTGDHSTYKSQSEGEFAFCFYLSAHTSSPKLIDKIYRESDLYREKWDEKRGKSTYGDITIAKALKKSKNAQTGSITENDPQYLVAQKVISEIGSRNLYSYAGQIWLWSKKEGVWSVAADEEIKKRIHKVAHRNNISQNHVNSILGIIRTEVYSKVNHFNKQNRSFINTKSGELHYIYDEWKLKKHNRKNYSILQIPVTYDSNAKCKRFNKFLNQIFEPDPDKIEKIKLLQEFMGYALTTTCQFERSLILVGSGGNGKSVILELLKALLGSNNVAGVQPNQLENRFQLGHLYGKLANIITEIPTGSVIDDAKYKALVSGERITAEHKFQKPFDFEPYATLFFATNHLPHTKDFSHAFFRRNEILTFNVQFKGSDCDTTLKTEIQKELPGILNFALAGLKRLYDNGNFTQVASSLSTKLEWERTADQVKAFFDDECMFDPTSKVSIGVLYIRYERWTQNNEIKSKCNKPTFSARLTRLGCERVRGANGLRMISGVKLRDS
jgi:P4 family phage/plasmid primase-like protien